MLAKVLVACATVVTTLLAALTFTGSPYEVKTGFNSLTRPTCAASMFVSLTAHYAW
jgi:hypothetical protein